MPEAEAGVRFRTSAQSCRCGGRWRRAHHRHVDDASFSSVGARRRRFSLICTFRRFAERSLAFLFLPPRLPAFKSARTRSFGMYAILQQHIISLCASNSHSSDMLSTVKMPRHLAVVKRATRFRSGPARGLQVDHRTVSRVGPPDWRLSG